MKINNEKEKYTLHFIYHKNILHIKSSWIPVMDNNVNITYQVMGRQQVTQNNIYVNYQEKYIQVYIDYLID